MKLSSYFRSSSNQNLNFGWLWEFWLCRKFYGKITVLWFFSLIKFRNLRISQNLWQNLKGYILEGTWRMERYYSNMLIPPHRIPNDPAKLKRKNSTRCKKPSPITFTESLLQSPDISYSILSVKNTARRKNTTDMIITIPLQATVFNIIILASTYFHSVLAFGSQLAFWHANIFFTEITKLWPQGELCLAEIN